MIRPSPILALVTALPLLSGCVDDTGDGAEGRAAPDPREGVEPPLRETLRGADRLADSIEGLLRPLPLLRPGEEAALRRFPNAAQVARARELGVRPADQEALDSLVEAGRVVQLEDSTAHWIVRDGPRYVVPHTRALLEELGRRFQERLGAMGIPPYRLEVTSALRTPAEQAALRRTNPNAAAGTSAHEFGTTVDIAYSAFAPPAELPEGLVADAPEWLRPYLHRTADLALESVSARKSRELKAILGHVLTTAQDEGLVMVTLERLQPVYHMTVARPLADAAR